MVLSRTGYGPFGFGEMPKANSLNDGRSTFWLERIPTCEAILE
jgi:hypothetical protein